MLHHLQDVLSSSLPGIRLYRFFLGIDVLEWMRIDDPVGCFPVHGIAGVWSLIAVGFFAETVSTENKTMSGSTTGLFKGGKLKLMGSQVLSCLCITVWAMVTNLIEVSRNVGYLTAYFCTDIY